MARGGARQNAGRKRRIDVAIADAQKKSSSQTQLPFVPKNAQKKKKSPTKHQSQKAAESPQRSSSRIAARKGVKLFDVFNAQNEVGGPKRKMASDSSTVLGTHSKKGASPGVVKDSPPIDRKHRCPITPQIPNKAAKPNTSRLTRKSKDEKDGNEILKLYFDMKDPCKPSAKQLYGDGDSDSDEDDDYEPELEDERDIDFDADESQQAVYKRAQYQPPKGSPLGTYLESQKEAIKLELKSGKDKKWYFSDFTPTSSGRCEPKRYYCGKVMIYVHDPLTHHSNQIPGDPMGCPATFSCVHCKKAGALKGNAWSFRPAHYADTEVWVLHRRYVCQTSKVAKEGESRGCGKTFANFHPSFMEQLPNVVSETFPFLMTVGGLGMHISMMDQFMVACTKGIMFGAYTSMVNESKKMKYYRDHCTYLDNIHDRMKQVKETRSRGFMVVEPNQSAFSAFNTPGEYNGILLKASLVKALFLKVMRTLEDYLQASFQLNLDESESPDHSFKFAKMIMSFVRCGKIWTGTYDSVSLKGLITMNFFCHTKSNDEIHAAIVDNKRVREFTEAPELKRIEGDGGGDASAWTSVYPSSLVDKTNPYKEMWNEGLPRARLSKDSIQVFTDCDSLERVMLALENFADDWTKGPNGADIYYGLDTEQNHDGKTKTIQLCLPNVFYKRIIVVDLGSMKISCKVDFQKKLRHFSSVLTRADMIPVAVQISHDVKHLLELGVDRGNNKVVDLANVAKQLEPSHPDGFSLQKLSARYLKYYVSKEYQTSNWDTLTESMTEYAALDAYLHLRLYQEIQNLVTLARKHGTLPVHSSLPTFNLGNRVNILFNGQSVGSGTLEFIGGSGGESKKFGDITVGRGKSIVAIDEPTQKPSFPSNGYIVVKEDQGVSIPCKAKLSTVFEKHAVDGRLLVIFITSSLALFMDLDKGVEAIDASSSEDNESNLDRSTSLLDLCNTDPIILPDAPPVTQQAAALPAPTTPTNKTIPDDVLVYADDVVADNNILPLTRTFLDRFHIFDSFPSSRDIHEKAALKVIRRIAFATVTTFDEEDLSAVIKFLREKRNIHHLNDIIDYFFFNKEWWYQRVRMYPPTADESVENINQVSLGESQVTKFVVHLFSQKFTFLAKAKEMILNDKHLAKFWTAKLDKWFDALTRICREGKMEETTDCVMFQWIGQDKNGLDLYLRRRGSNRSELLHQKMRVAFGPHGIGAEVGHYLLLWITYRFNVSTGIKRLNHHNFGIHQLHLIDRIQTRYAQLFGCDVFPRHQNQMQKKTIPGLVSVGIRPLDYDDMYVKKGPCHASLHGDLRFIAERSGVVCPPMPISHPKEKVIFNQFMLHNQKLTTKSWDELSATFAVEAEKDGYQTIFPKIPSMLKNYYGTWKLNAEIKWVQRGVNDPLYELLGKFLMKSSSDPSEAAKFQSRESNKKPTEDIKSELSGLEKTSMELEHEKLPMNPLPVPPGVAPLQQHYVPSSAPTGEIEGVVVDLRSTGGLCVGAFLGCKRTSGQCKRFYCDLSRCQHVITNRIDLSNEAELKRKQAEYKTERKRLLAARARMLKKAQYKEATVQDNKQDTTDTTTQVVKEDPSSLAFGPAKVQHTADQNSAYDSASFLPVRRDDLGVELPPEDHFQMLDNQEWLSGKIIDWWLERQNYLDQEDFLQDRTNRRIMFCSHDFMNLLLKCPEDQVPTLDCYDYTTTVKNFSRKKFERNFFEKDKVFFSIHKPNHWISACIDVQKESITILDPLNCTNETNHVYAKALHQFVQDLSVDSNNAPSRDHIQKKWQLITNPSGIAKQNNGYDCGVFVCMYAECIQSGKALNFSQQDATLKRHEMRQLLHNC